jgi:serine/threonine-protein kinase
VIYGGATAGGDEHLMVRAADATGEPQVLLSSNHHQTPYTISPDGAWVVFRDEVPNQRTKLGILDMRTHDAKLLLGTKFNERDAEISPDGHLMAYQSDDTGRMEVYVRPFPNVNDGKRQVSNGGGLRPVWSRDGRRLYYMTDDVLPATMDVVERKAGAALEFGASVIAFDLAPFEAQPLLGRTFDIGADGRFLMPKRTSDTSAQPGLTLLLNWAAHLGANR